MRPMWTMRQSLQSGGHCIHCKLAGPLYGHQAKARQRLRRNAMMRYIWLVGAIKWTWSCVGFGGSVTGEDATSIAVYRGTAYVQKGKGGKLFAA